MAISTAKRPSVTTFERTSNASTIVDLPVRRVAVVGDGVRRVEALLRDAVLEVQVARSIAELQVVLPGHEAVHEALNHAVPSNTVRVGDTEGLLR